MRSAVVNASRRGRRRPSTSTVVRAPFDPPRSVPGRPRRSRPARPPRLHLKRRTPTTVEPWSDCRRPTGVFKRARCPRSQERHRLCHRLSRGDSTHAGPSSVPGTACAPLGARASRPQVGRRPTGVFKRARCPRSQERQRLCHRLSRGDSTHAAPARPPGPRVPPLGARASRPQVGRRPTGVQAGKMPAFPGKAPPVSSSLPRRLDPRVPARSPGARAPPWDRGRPARKWAEGPPVCSSRQDARAPRKGSACVIVSPEATRPTRPPLGPRDRGCPPWERGRPARKWAEGPQVCVQAGKMPALPGKAPPVSSSLPRRLDPRRPPLGPRDRGRPPGSAGVPPASGPKAHRCSSRQDARVPRKGTACVIVSPEATRRARSTPAPARPPGPRAPPWERGRPARKWAEGPQVCVQAGKMPAFPGKAPPVSSSLPRRLDALDPRRPPLGPRDRVRPPGSAGVPPASGPEAHRCVQAGKMPALPGKAPFDDACLERAPRRWGAARRRATVPASPGAGSCSTWAK